MKIAYLLGSLNRGGTETLMLDVFRNATSNELDTIGIYRKSGVLENDFLNSGVKMYHLPTGKNMFSYLLRLRSIITINKIEIVHAQQPIDAILATLATVFLKAKVLLTLHGYDFEDAFFTRFLLRFILKNTNRNLYVSDRQKNYYTDKYKLLPKKQLSVYNGISFDKFTIANSDTDLRKELNIGESPLILTAVGNFNQVRDQLTLCKFAYLLKQQNIDFRLLLVGKRIDALGGLYDNCTNYCKENQLLEHVLFKGVRQDVPQILNQSDAFLYATNHDTFGIAVVEALACGIPVFVNDWEVMIEITENGKLATLYKTKDEKDLFNHFLLFLQHKEQFTLKAQLAAKSVCEKYSIKKHITELKKVYESVY